MPRYRVTVCFTSYSYYEVEVNAASEDAIDDDAVIELASESEADPVKRDSGDPGEIIEIIEIDDRDEIYKLRDQARLLEKWIDNPELAGDRDHVHAFYRVELAKINATRAAMIYVRSTLA